MGLFIEQKRNRMPEGIKIIEDEYNKKLAMYGYASRPINHCLYILFFNHSILDWKHRNG